MDWRTWSPFQSAGVREVCAHMTAAERHEFSWRGVRYGFWVAISFAIPLSLALTFRSPITLVLAGILVPTHVLFIPVWQRKQRQFLCSTAWAINQGLTPENLKLFGRGQNSG